MEERARSRSHLQQDALYTAPVTARDRSMAGRGKEPGGAPRQGGTLSQGNRRTKVTVSCLHRLVCRLLVLFESSEEISFLQGESVLRTEPGCQGVLWTDRLMKETV